MLKDIMNELFQLSEAKDIDKDSFEYFFVDEIKDLDVIVDVEELGDRKNVEVLLITDETYEEDDPGKGQWYKIDTEDIIKFLEETVDKFEDGDYLDFGGSFTLDTCIKKYIESKCECKCFDTWEDFIGTMDGSVGNDLNKLSEVSSREIYFNSFSAAVQFARSEAEKKGYNVDEDDWAREVNFGRGRPKRGSTTRMTIGLTKNGKSQRKALHMQVYDMGRSNKNYELNWYIS
jgi:hypothetical protein